MKEKLEFYEKQKMSIWLLAFILVAITTICVIPAIFNKEMLNLPLATGLLLSVAVILAIYFLFSLQTIINKDGIFVKMMPIMRKYKQFSWEDIENVYVRKYNPILEYGGWGYRSGLGRNFNINSGLKMRIGMGTKGGFGKGTAYNMRGNIGLQLELKNGKKVLVGTQRGEEIEEILKIAEAKNLLSQ
jgi:hypothetical protein